jgi:hypothetical protein
MRDITLLESADRVAAGAPVHLYEPLPGLRNARSGSAAMVYSLATAPKDSLKVEFVDSAGTAVRTMRFVGRAGTSRVTWDLRYDPPRAPALRTTPPDNPHIWDEARFKNKSTRPIVHWGIEQPQRVGPLAAAGNYTVRLTVDGQVYSEPFTVTQDPEISSSVADLQLSTRTQARIRDDIDTTAGIINAIEIVRKQIEDDEKSGGSSADLTRSLQTLDQKALGVEMRLLTRSDLHSDDKWYVEQPRVYLDLIWLYGEVGTGAGDVAGGADYRPTDASIGVLGEVESDLSGAKSAFAEFLAKDLPAFNASMAGKLPPITEKLPDRKPALVP